jgi:hypothetical protein
MSEETASEAVAETVEQAQEAPETFSLEYVQQLRSEAAKYRSERKAAVEAAKVAAEAEFQSKLDEAGARFTELEQAKAASDLQVLKYQKVVEAEVPAELVADLVALVQGYDEESISESVAKLKSASLQRTSPPSSPLHTNTLKLARSRCRNSLDAKCCSAHAMSMIICRRLRRLSSNGVPSLCL